LHASAVLEVFVLGVVDGAVLGEFLAAHPVEGFVGVQLGLAVRHLAEVLTQGLASHVGNVLGAHPAALYQSMDGMLARLRLALVDDLLLAAHKRLVAFNDLALAAQRANLGVGTSHRAGAWSWNHADL